MSVLYSVGCLVHSRDRNNASWPLQLIFLVNFYFLYVKSKCLNFIRDISPISSGNIFYVLSEKWIIRINSHSFISYENKLFLKALWPQTPPLNLLLIGGNQQIILKWMYKRSSKLIHISQLNQNVSNCCETALGVGSILLVLKCIQYIQLKLFNNIELKKL